LNFGYFVIFHRSHNHSKLWLSLLKNIKEIIKKYKTRNYILAQMKSGSSIKKIANLWITQKKPLLRKEERF